MIPTEFASSTCSDRRRAETYRGRLGVAVWSTIVDELAEHEPYESAEAYWSDFLWAARFLLLGGDEAAFAAADAARDADRAAEAKAAAGESTTAGAIVEALAAKGIPAAVHQTGGNCATVYIGEGKEDTVAIGPGCYDWHHPALSEFDWDGLAVGLSDDEDRWQEVRSMAALVEAVEWYMEG